MRGPWEYEDPACADVGGDFWFPEFSQEPAFFVSKDERQIETQIAKSICNGCTHKIECQQWGLRKERFGIWGGLTERDRVPIRRRLNIIIKEESVA